MTIYAVKRSDGGVSIMNTIDETVDPAAEVAKWEADVQAQVVGWRVIPFAPVDRTFRNAWEDNGADVVVNMVKARNMWREKMRAARTSLLAALDAEFIRALESGLPVRDNPLALSVIAKKNALRAVTSNPAIDAAQTPEALKLVWPSILGPQTV